MGLSEDSCLICGGEIAHLEQGYVCEGCLMEIKPYHPFNYEKLGLISRYRVYGRYESTLAEVIRLIKFRSVKPLAYTLGERISGHLGDFLEEAKPDILTYVPVHSWRLWSRGFDHNRVLLEGAGVKYDSLLLRRKHSKPLAYYEREKRFVTVKDAFGVRKELADRVEGKKILVFDDVLTTGATSTTICELLLSLGAEDVFFYFLAKEG
ncbi:ComF family protein [Hydrogenivirga caldilitoris]|uniref:ComF family protein n=1 Tax=Hydrogenivirga caldilitoris TaxID=246264 RepID=UPI0011C454E3|nr:ComF family protein [Hydrogenivirga caldilitoris]